MDEEKQRININPLQLTAPLFGALGIKSFRRQFSTYREYKFTEHTLQNQEIAAPPENGGSQ